MAALGRRGKIPCDRAHFDAAGHRAARRAARRRGNGASAPRGLFAALLGNLLPVPFIILFARRGFAWVRAHIPRLGRWVDRIEQKAWSKSDKVVRYQAWGLLLFVAVPLPGTGAWTGALIAALLDLRLKLAVPAITAGVFLAGIIISLLTYGAAALL